MFVRVYINVADRETRTEPTLTFGDDIAEPATKRIVGHVGKEEAHNEVNRQCRWLGDAQ